MKVVPFKRWGVLVHPHVLYVVTLFGPDSYLLIKIKKEVLHSFHVNNSSLGLSNVLKMFINGSKRCHISDTYLRIKPNQYTIHDPRGAEKYNYTMIKYRAFGSLLQ